LPSPGSVSTGAQGSTPRGENALWHHSQTIAYREQRKVGILIAVIAVASKVGKKAPQSLLSLHYIIKYESWGIGHHVRSLRLTWEVGYLAVEQAW
jgi:hypothetical protein